MNAMTELDKVSYMGLNGDMIYGPAADRMQPDTSTIFAYDPAAPGSLKALATQYVAPQDEAPASDPLALTMPPGAPGGHRL